MCFCRKNMQRRCKGFLIQNGQIVCRPWQRRLAAGMSPLDELEQIDAEVQWPKVEMVFNKVQSIFVPTGSILTKDGGSHNQWKRIGDKI